MQPDLVTLQALSSLFEQADFKRFRAFLEAVAMEETNRAINTTDHSGVARGRAQMIIWLRHQIETCRETTKQMEIRNGRAHPARR